MAARSCTSEAQPASDSDGELVSFEAAAATDWEPMPLNEKALDAEAAGRLLNPHMPNVRIAAVMMAKTKAELIEVVKQLGGVEHDGGELAIMVASLHATEKLFAGYVELLQAADARLFAATCAATLAAGITP